MIVVLRKRRQPGFERAGKPVELLLSPRVSADAPPDRAAHTRAKAAVLDLQRPGLCETQTGMGHLLSISRFGLVPVLCWSGKAVLRPVACDQVRGARGRGQGTETLGKA